MPAKGCSARRRTVSFRLDVVLARHGTPCLHLSTEEAAKLLGSAEGERYLLSLRELRGDALFTYASRKVAAKPINRSLRRADRRKHAPPSIRLETGKTALADSRHGAKGPRARFAGLSDGPKSAGLDFGMESAVLPMTRSTCPAMASFIAGAPPRYGTWTRRMPARVESCAMARCPTLPLPTDA